MRGLKSSQNSAAAQSSSGGEKTFEPLGRTSALRSQFATSLAYIALLVAVVVGAGRGETAIAQGLAGVGIVVMAVHAVMALGWLNAIVLAVSCLTVTYAVENLGQLTGFPFGPYRFLVGEGLPHVGVIPIIVGPLYFGVGYPAWVIASLVLNGRPPSRPRGRQILLLPMVAAVVETQWDVVMDPVNSTLGGSWRWADGGGYFGVPWTNFAGWLLVTWAYFQVFAVLLSARGEAPPSQLRSRTFWAAPVLLYLASGLCEILPWLQDGDKSLRDAVGHVWSAAGLRQSAVVVMFATMAPTSFLALLRLSEWNQRHAAPAD